MRLSAAPLALAFVFGGCGDDNKIEPDAPKADAPPPDGFDPLSFADNEGGEIRLEWIKQFTAAGVEQTTARATAYFYKSQTPGKFALPAFPGCFDMRLKDKWPLAQGTIVPLDVGGVTIKSTGSDLVMVPDMGVMADPFSRPHALWYKKTSNLPGNDGDMFLPPNQTYDIVLAGSAEWPAQTINDVAFMPERWDVSTPPANATTMLVADTDFTMTYTPVVSSNLPPGYRVNTVVAFQGTGHMGPIVLCQEEGTDGSITVPAALVNVLRAYTPGRYVRQNLTHALFELTDGAPKPPGERKRVDVLSIWCTNTGWAAAP
jgi:hypothetical protein